MRIQILGPSSTKTLRLEMLVRECLADLGMRDARVERLKPRDTERLIWSEPPLLVVDGQIVWSGGKELPTKDMVRQLVRETIMMPV